MAQEATPQRHPTDGEGHAAEPGSEVKTEFTVIDDGGPAFPQTIDDSGTLRARTEGMSLRDHFAAKAMEGTIAGCQSRAADATANLNYHTVAIDSYKYADAMLAARKAVRA